MAGAGVVASGSATRRKASGADPQVAGGLNHLAVCYANVYDYVSDLLFPINWTDVAQITKATLVLATPADASTTPEVPLLPIDKSGVSLYLLASAFPDNTSASYVTTTVTPKRATSPAPISNGVIGYTKGAKVESRIDVTTFVGAWAPSSVKRSNGSPGLGLHNYGLEMIRRSYTAHTSPSVVIASERTGVSADRPYILLDYVAKPAPGVTILTGPASPITQIEGQYFGGTFTPGKASRRLAFIQIQAYAASVPAGSYDDTGSAALWNKTNVASASDTATNNWLVPLPVQLNSAATYNWRARCRDQEGSWSPWTAARALQVRTQNPSLATLAPVGSKPNLNGVLFQARYSDPDGNRIRSYRIQVRSRTTSADPNWGDGPFFWDTSDQPASATERRWLPEPWTGASYSQISRLYGGQPLDPGNYSYRITATDDLGADSAPVYVDFAITVGTDVNPGENDYLTGYARRQVRARVVIRDRGTNNGPGTALAIIEDAANLGGSEFYNSGGEFFFTLPATHPQVAVIEPWKVHYALEVYRGQGWTEIATGLITDFDASDDDVIFYGVDYLGLLGLSVDDRFKEEAAEAVAGLYPATPGGSKYINRTVAEIVSDQINRAIHGTDSPLAFFTIGPIAAMNEKLQIFSTFRQRLPFIAGLLESHKGANVGIKTRIRARRNPALLSQWQFIVEDNPGKDRAAVRFEYGGLVQGFRAIPFGDLGTRVYAIGRAVQTGSKPFYIPDILGVLPETGTTGYGRLPKVNVWENISDRADLERRARVYARTISKVGKRIALGIRVDSVQVKDGWDITDSVPVKIDRGVVDTDRFGSGWYTIWGWTFQVFPDGHSDLTLTILPRLDTEGPDVDLIESDPIHNTPEWAIGKGAPTATTFAMVATRTYVNGDTGEVYDYDTAAGAWVLNTEVVGGTPGPPGPAGPPGGAGFRLGEFNWKTARGPAGSQQATLAADIVAGVANNLNLSETDIGGANRTPYLGLAKSGDFVYVDDQAGHVVRVQLTADPVDQGTYWSFPFTPATLTGVNEPANNADVIVAFDSTTLADTIPPPVPVVLGIVAVSAQSEDGNMRIAMEVSVGYSSPPAGLTDLGFYHVQTTRLALPGQDAPDWTNAIYESAPSPDATGTAAVGIAIVPVLPVTKYWVRVAAEDKAGNWTAWSTTVYEHISGRDDEGPPLPSGVVTEPGNLVAGIRWDAVNVDDLGYYEVRWQPVGATTWASIRINGTIVVLTELSNGLTYHVQVRSVDSSGNALLQIGSNPDGSAIFQTVLADDEPEAGWVAGVDVTPQPLAGDSLVWTDAMITNVFAGRLNADWLKAGTITVGSGLGAITVVDGQGRIVGKWDSTGLRVLDPTNPNYELVMTAAGLTIWDRTDPANPIPRVRLTPLGIDAASITFGSQRGGHNLVANSSFELGSSGVLAVTNYAWTVAADWTATRQGADTNVTTGATDLRATAAGT